MFLINNNSLCEKIQINRSILIENNRVLISPSIILSRNHFITRSLFLKWDLTQINIIYNNVSPYFPKIKFHEILNDFSRKKEKGKKRSMNETWFQKVRKKCSATLNTVAEVISETSSFIRTTPCYTERTPVLDTTNKPLDNQHPSKDLQWSSHGDALKIKENQQVVAGERRINEWPGRELMNAQPELAFKIASKYNQKCITRDHLFSPGNHSRENKSPMINRRADIHAKGRLKRGGWYYCS